MTAIAHPVPTRSPCDAADARTVTATLSYLCRDGRRPRSYSFLPPPGVPQESGRYEARAVTIHDARAARVAPSLEREGFELWDAPSRLHDFSDERAIREVYYPEAVELALLATGARRAWVFDHLVRRRGPAGQPLGFGRRAADGSAGANGRIHNDYTQASGERRLGLVLTDERVRAGVRRHAIVNIWRPLRGPVLDAPLALCDARTVRSSDLVESEVIYPHRTGEIYLLAHSASHRWSYFPRMQAHEAIVFKQYDSRTSGAPRYTPHSAFDHPDTPAGTPPRESIELRCLVTD